MSWACGDTSGCMAICRFVGAGLVAVLGCHENGVNAVCAYLTPSPPTTQQQPVLRGIPVQIHRNNVKVCLHTFSEVAEKWCYLGD